MSAFYTTTATVLTSMASLRLSSPSAAGGSIPPTPRIPQQPFSPSPRFSQHSPSYFDVDSYSPSPSTSASTASLGGLLTPVTPPRAVFPAPAAATSSHAQGIAGLGLGLAGLTKPDGSGLAFTGLGVLPSSSSFDEYAYAPSNALLAEVYAAFSPAASSPPPSEPRPFLLTRAELRLRAVDLTADMDMDVDEAEGRAEGRIYPARVEDIFWSPADAQRAMVLGGRVVAHRK
ncbi:hypothetical protein GLOTRDRAFT_126137 [Gloeophyllum trabeum ATCC 11539]|uniref:Uncharacterized protein n=1 Tax=Gloeophyllum trabeum (strain ATCC 11539 / FP-39264 / Madison 617) TaxID=670483 RepID=S7QKQ8_GLOTA|nr:uncharacterized protein GLOTRDRAFT_126137 [Gloeophyllum trabeum ATCC 11539]EPQ59843.1 hypothetical protein GLOTRDRAFT_126137 [Gloeophyllum trabeum ATCC 11539]